MNEPICTGCSQMNNMVHWLGPLPCSSHQLKNSRNHLKSMTMEGQEQDLTHVCSLWLCWATALSRCQSNPQGGLIGTLPVPIPTIEWFSLTWQRRGDGVPTQSTVPTIQWFSLPQQALANAAMWTTMNSSRSPTPHPSCACSSCPHRSALSACPYSSPDNTYVWCFFC
jgi:hypothetical protein